MHMGHMVQGHVGHLCRIGLMSKMHYGKCRENKKDANLSGRMGGLLFLCLDEASQCAYFLSMHLQ